MKFQHYGDIDIIFDGEGTLYLKNGKEYDVSFAIAKHNEKALLFNLASESIDPFKALSLFGTKLNKLEGLDKKGRKIKATGLLSKDSTTDGDTNSITIVNGYVSECKIGELNIESGFSVHFDLTNFLFLGNETKIEQSDRGKRYSRSILKLSFDDFYCRIEKAENYSTVAQLLKRQGGVLKTSTLIVQIDNYDDYKSSFEKVRKLCQLLSVARSTFINWGSCKVFDTEGKVVYEFHGQAQSRNYHGNNLIKDLPNETVKFLKKAWIEYDQYKELLDLKRVIYGYIDTFQNSYVETRCLNIAALTESICSRWAIHEKRYLFIDKTKFESQLPKLNNSIEKALRKEFSNLNDSHKQIMLNKVTGFNRRPLDWKLKRLRKAFNCPITDEEISRFVELRDNLAHSSLFPENTDNTDAFLFMRHFLDRIILRILDYKGTYFDMEERKQTILQVKNS